MPLQVLFHHSKKEQFGLPTFGWAPGYTCTSWGGGRVEEQDISSQIQVSQLGGLRRREAIKRVVLHCTAWEFSLGRRLQSPEIPWDRVKWEKGHAWDAALLSAVSSVLSRL